jgi:predicted TIM-barrel fold metal-dependent hydrolase
VGWQPDRYQLGFAQKAAHRRLPYRDPMSILPRVMPGSSDPTGEYLIADMDRAGIDVAVAMSVDFGVGTGQEQTTPLEVVFETHAELTRKYPGRFYAFFGMDPRRPGAPEMFRRALTEWGYKGLKMYPGSGYYPYDEICHPYYRICVEYGVPVLYHTAPTQWPFTPRYAHPTNLGDVQRLFPDLQIIFGHSGGNTWWREATATAAGHWSSYLELSHFARRSATDPGKMYHVLGQMRDEVGAHRLLYASDFAAGPAMSGPNAWLLPWIQFFKELPEKAAEHGVSFTPEERDLILGGNAARLLRL